jgi:alcohol dehydrogenase class IV
MKAVSVMTVNPGSVTDYHGTGKPLVAGIPKAAVPTTAGTGSEVTPGAVLVNPKTAFKRGLGGPLVCPDFAILDASLTQSMPLPVAAATGMDALTHSIESFTAKCANTMTRMYSREAFSLVYRNLPKTLRGEADLDARRNVMLGSCLAGFAILNSDTGACHSMAYPLGIYHKVPHGVAVGLIIPKVVEINVEKGCEFYADLLDIAEPGAAGSPAEKSRRFAALLARFPAFDHMDRKLTRYGIEAKDVDFLAERGLDLKSALGNNPVPFGLDDAKRVLRQLV